MRFFFLGAIALAACGAPAKSSGPAPVPHTSPPPAELPGEVPLVDGATWERYEGADYLAIGPRDLLAGLGPLVALREKQGHVVAQLVTEDVFARFSRGREDALAIHAAIRTLHRHTAGKLRFVLLVGDAPSPMPAFTGEKIEYLPAVPVDPMAFPSFGQHDTRYATDAPYARVEPVTRSFAKWRLAPATLAVGRIPARGRDEVDAFVGKLVQYETAPTDAAWQRRMAVFAGPADFGPLADALIESTAMRLLDEEVSYDFDLSFVFAKLGSPYAFRFDRLGDKITSDLSQGALIAAYVGHGSTISFDDVYFRGAWYDFGTLEDARRLRIPEGKPFFVSLTCSTGAFDMPGPHRSMAEELAMNPDGPIAVFASSRESHPYPNALYGAALAARFGRARPRTIGEGLIAVRADVRDASLGLAQLLVENDVDDLKDEHEGLYNLLGDPATRLRYPEIVEVKPAADRVAPGGSIVVDVTAPGIDNGRITLTLETRRGTVRWPTATAAELERLSSEEALARMSADHQRASDKIVSKRTATWSGGRARLELTAPDSPGPYVVKALVSGGGRTGAGHAKLTITAAPALVPSGP